VWAYEHLLFSHTETSAENGGLFLRGVSRHLASGGSPRHNLIMEEVLLMTGLFVAGAGAGALLTYKRDHSLLALYGHLVQDLSRMVPHSEPDPPEPPAAAMRVAEIPPIVEAQRKAAS